MPNYYNNSKCIALENKINAMQKQIGQLMVDVTSLKMVSVGINQNLERLEEKACPVKKEKNLSKEEILEKMWKLLKN